MRRPISTLLVGGALFISGCYRSHVDDDTPDASARATCSEEARPRPIAGFCLPRREIVLPAGRAVQLEVVSLDMRDQSRDHPPPDCRVTLEGQSIRLELMELEVVPDDVCALRPRCPELMPPFGAQFSYCELPPLEPGPHTFAFGSSSLDVEVIADAAEATRTCWGVAAPLSSPPAAHDQACVDLQYCADDGLVVYATTTCPDAVCVSWKDDVGTSHARLDGLEGCDRGTTRHFARCFPPERMWPPDFVASALDFRGASLPSDHHIERCVDIE